MKSKLFKKTVALTSAVAMIGSMGIVPLSANAANVSISHQFEDGEKVFTDDSRITGAIENDETLNSNVISFTNAGNAQNGYSFAHYDFSKEVLGATKTTIEFDYYNTNGGRAILSLGDASVRGTTGNSSKVTYSNKGAAFNIGSDKSNSIIQDSKIAIASLTNKWLHVSVVVDEVKNTLTYEVTDKSSGSVLASSNGEVAFLNSEASAVTQIDVFGYINSSKCAKLDNISINAEISDTAMYDINYNVDGKTSLETVQEGNSPTKVPTDTAKTGYIFKGWSTDGSSEYDASKTYVSSEEILASKVTGAVTYTAVYEKDADYIESMEKIEFSTVPSGNLLTAGADENTAADNNFAIKITGELGSDITASPDSRVTDYKVEYTLKGFNWKSHDKQPTSDSTEWPYCDSYGKLVTDGAAADFQLKSHPFNYYGQLVAKVTYNGKTLETSTPIAYIGNPQANTNTNQVLPRGGYYEDANAYSPDMVGYVAAISGDNITASDVVTDNWAAYGGNTKNVSIQEENGSKFFRLEAFGTNSSSFAMTRIDAVKDSQVVFDQMVRFHNTGTSILLKTANPVTWNDNATTFSASFENGKVSLNGSEICDAATGVWYRVLITSDVTSGKCYAEVYSEDGTKLGASEIVNFTNAGSTNPTYYGYRTPDRATGKCDFNKVTVKRAVLDESTIATTSTADTIAIPEAGKPSVSETLTIDAKTTDGLPAIGKAEWSIADETITGVTLTPSEEDSHTATVTVAEGASAGELPINVTIAGKTKTINLTLSSSQDSLKFTESSSSVSIPLSSTETSVNTYKAVVINGDGEEIEGKDVTYALYDSKNANPISAPAGVTFENGVLTVTSEAKPVTLYVRATSTNTQNETITKAIKVTIHGLSFDFGLDSEDALADGYTAVTPSTTYNAKLGFGIEGSPTVGGTASVDDADSDYLGGNFTFKVNVENNTLYKVTLNHSGNAVFEHISDDLSGVVRSNTEMGKKEYYAYVNDGVLDINFDVYNYTEKVSETESVSKKAESMISSVSIEKVEKDAAVKPNVYTIGDSTIANNGSWAYVLARDFGNYTELGNYVTFSNNGRGGKNLSSYYTGGELWDRVVSNIRPGDYVMIGDMGTNGMGNDFEGSFTYYINTCLERGAKVILNSYSPHGAVGDYASGYNKETQTFDSYRKDAYDNIVRAIYEERKSELVGFVDIGKNADTAFNAYVDDYAANGYESRDAAAQAIISCFGDHNHYSNGSLAAKLMIEGYNGTPGIVSELTKLVANENPQPTEEPTTSPSAKPTEEPTTSPSAKPTEEPTTSPSTKPTEEPTTSPSAKPTEEPTTSPSTKPTDEPSTSPFTVYTDGTVEVKLDNVSNAVLAIVKYDENGRLVSVKTSDLTFTDGKAEAADKAEAGDVLTVWNTVKDMKPLTAKEAAKLTAERPSETDTPAETTEPSETDTPAETANPEKEAKVVWKAAKDAAKDEVLAENIAAANDLTYVPFTLTNEDGTPGDETTRIIDGVEFTGYISHASDNGSWSGTSLDPAKPTAVKYTAAESGVLTAYLSGVGENKVAVIAEEGLDKNTVTASGEAGRGDMSISKAVEAGKTYYILVMGSKGRFCGIAFDKDAAVDPVEPSEPTPTPSAPDVQENVWTMSAAYNNCAAGTELMKGLTTLFADTKANGKYITSGENGSFSDGVATGTALKYIAEKNGKLSVSFTGLGAKKTVYVVEENSKQANAVASTENSSETDKIDGTVEADVVAGTTYYIYGAGTKACFNGASFTAAE